MYFVWDCRECAVQSWSDDSGDTRCWICGASMTHGDNLIANPWHYSAPPPDVFQPRYL